MLQVGPFRALPRSKNQYNVPRGWSSLNVISISFIRKSKCLEMERNVARCLGSSVSKGCRYLSEPVDNGDVYCRVTVPNSIQVLNIHKFGGFCGYLWDGLHGLHRGSPDGHSRVNRLCSRQS